MNPENHLIIAENKWLLPAYVFLERAFKTTPLPSHDHRHHYRVWQNARQLLLQLEKLGVSMEPSLVEALLLGCMFHDVGMLHERGKDHGAAGTEIFLQFIHKNTHKPKRLEDIIDTIREHDDKSYVQAGRLLHEGKIQLLPALQISDDLDAYGYIGIYRFSEIYLLRGTAMEDLGLKIIANLSSRYGNFMANCSRFPEMIKIQSIRQHTIESFFRHYNLQIRKKEHTGEEPAGGPFLVIKHIYRQVMMNAASLEEASKNIIDSEKDVYVQRFFTSLKNELEMFHYPNESD